MTKKSSVQVNITIPLEWKQSDIEMVAKARAWAVKAHAGQKDKAGKDYFKAHVTVVAEGVKGGPIAEAVAFLHDTVEDTSVTIEDIRTGFPKEVADAVSTLTHSKGISYAEYLWYIQQNSIAVKVKLSDLRSNMDLTRLPHTPTERDLERTRKYKRAYTILSSREGIVCKRLKQTVCKTAPLQFTGSNPVRHTIKPLRQVGPSRQPLKLESAVRVCQGSYKHLCYVKKVHYAEVA